MKRENLVRKPQTSGMIDDIDTIYEGNIGEDTVDKEKMGSIVLKRWENKKSNKNVRDWGKNQKDMV
jgi:hypothetical protein